LEGWVDREKLLSFSGRSRKPQISLANKLNIKEFSQPAGGCCFLTDSSYSSKMRDLWQSRGEKDYDLDDIMLLKVGRHLRPNEHLKMIISRDKGETNYLMGYRKKFHHLLMVSHKGPITLLQGNVSKIDFSFAAKIAARFGQGKDAKAVSFVAANADGLEKHITVSPFKAAQIKEEWYL